MTVIVHDPRAVPEGCAPSAPVIVGTIRVKDEPTALHFRVTEGLAAATRHLGRARRQIHVLRRIAIEVIDFQRAVAGWKVARGIGVGTALSPVPAVTTGCLETAGGADAALIRRPVAPTFVSRGCAVVSLAHALNARFRRDSLSQVKSIVRRFGRALAGVLPLVGITEALANGGA